LGSRNPYKGLSQAEARLALLEVFDLRMLLKRVAKKQLSTLYFAGCDIQLIPPKDIYLKMMDYSATSTVKITTEGLLRELHALRMQVVTYTDAAQGNTVLKALSVLWLDFTAVLEKYNTNAFTGTVVLSHTLVTLIEPERLRQTMIKNLHAAIQHGETVALYGKPPQRVDLLNVWSVYTYIHGSIVATIDPGMLTNGAFLENLMVTNFSHPHVPMDFLAMNRSPHRTFFREREREPKRFGNGADRNRNPKKPRTESAFTNSAATNSARPQSYAAPGAVDNRPPATGSPGRNGAGTGSGAPPPPRPPPPPPPRNTGTRNNNNGGKPTAAPRPGKDGGKENTPTPPSTCCMCREPGHKAYKCPRYDTCTCGTHLNGGKRHDPFRCPNGPLTDKGKAALAKLKKK
jgi:hypothetical protein